MEIELEKIDTDPFSESNRETVFLETTDASDKFQEVCKVTFNSLCQRKGHWYNADPVSRDFRSDIQVMRSLAVMLVLLFHLDIQFFSGGFIGVDIFFVISGYLVIGSIFRNCLNDKFDCFAFMANRIKRLFPASAICLLFVVLLFLIFPVLQKNAGSQGWYDIVWASLHVANIKYYVNENQYFKADNSVNFVLHYWSLALEEQFYLFFPMLFFVFYKITKWVKGSFFNKLTIAAFTIALGLVSLILCLIPQLDSSQKFFLLHTRIWEFLAGSLVALFQEEISDFIEENKVYRVIFDVSRYILICSLIICSIFVSSVLYPNGMTLLVVAITSAILACNKPIENVFLETIGNLSYSIYLYHFPIIQLFRTSYEMWLGDLSYGFQIKVLTILLLTAAAAAFSFYIIEEKSARLNFPPGIWYILLIVFSFMIAGIAVFLYTAPTLTLTTQVFTNNSFYGKPNFLNLDNMSYNQVELLQHNARSAGHTGYLSHTLDAYFSKYLEITSFPLEGKSKNNPNGRCMLIYGDSNAAQWFPAIIRLANTIATNTIFVAYSYDRFNTGKVYDDKEADEFIKRSMDNVAFQQCNYTVSIFARSSLHIFPYNKIQKALFFERVKRLTKYFAKRGCSVVIEGIPREPGEHNPNICLAKEIYDELNTVPSSTNKSTVLPVKFIKKCALNKNTSVFNYDGTLNGTNVYIFSMNKYLCVDDICPPNYYDVPIYMDQTHISEAMAFLLSATFVDEMINIPCVSSRYR